MTSEKEYNIFKDTLNRMYDDATTMLEVYTPTNIEQTYKYNRYNTLSEVTDLFNYYFNQSLSYSQTLIQIFENIIGNYYTRELEEQNKTDIGIKETYFNLLRELAFTDTIKRYYYDKDTYLLEGNYSKMLKSVHLYYY